MGAAITYPIVGNDKKEVLWRQRAQLSCEKIISLLKTIIAEERRVNH
jgi:hypothetical protein